MEHRNEESCLKIFTILRGKEIRISTPMGIDKRERSTIKLDDFVLIKLIRKDEEARVSLFCYSAFFLLAKGNDLCENSSYNCSRVGTGRIFCIRSGPASFKICPVRSGRNPAGSFLTSIRQKSGRNPAKNPAKKSKKIRFRPAG